MSSQDPKDVTHLVADLTSPEREKVVSELMPVVYDELRGLAKRYFQRERPNHTLQPTALVHEAYLRLVDQTRVDWQGRTHFYAVCAQAMRRVLVDYARGRGRERRGGKRQRVSLDSHILPAEVPDVDMVDLSDAIDRLAGLDPRQARVVELRFFAGLNMEEVAEAIGVSKRTAEGDWTHAKAWLRTEMEQGSDQDA